MRRVCRQILLSFALASVALIVIAGAVLAAWEFAFPIAVVDTGGTARTYVPVLTGVTGSSLNSAGYISATGTDTNMQIGSTSVPYMLSTTQIATVAPSLGAGSRINYNLYSGYSPVQTDFDIIVGTGGYITVSDDADLELGNDFEIEIDGYVDTSSGSDKNLVYKEDTFRIYVSGAEEITAGIIDTGTVSPYSSSSDGYLEYTDASYNTAWSATTAEAVEDGGTVIWFGQNFAGGIYYVRRAYFFCDTSGIPDNATVSSATLKLYGGNDASDTDFLITIQNGQPTYPSDPLADTDYDKSLYSGDGGSLTTSGFSTIGYNDIELNSTGLGWISLTGATKLCVRSSRDIAGTTPTGNEQVQVYSSEEAGTSKDPQLVVGYYYHDKEVAASSVSSGDMEVKVTADGTNFKIYIDDSEEDSTALSGTSVTDNANDWKINENDVMPYIDYYQHTVSDTLIAWYQPVGMITATTLPDRQGDAENGTITWGSNSNLTVTMGTVDSYESSTAEVAGDEIPGFDVETIDMPSGWYAGGDITSLPFYDNFNGISTDTGIPVSTLYSWSIYSVAIAVGFGTFVVFKPMLIGFLATLGVLWAGSSMGVIPGWVIFSFIILGIGIIYMRRTI